MSDGDGPHATPAPVTDPDAGPPLPADVRIREVGPRDGFQNEPEHIATTAKLELIAALARTGLPRMELTSLVRPDVVPQLADAEDVLAGADVPDGVQRAVLCPNVRGLERGLLVARPDGRRPFDDVGVFVSASESHNRANVNRSIADSLAGVGDVLARAGEAGLGRVAVIATSFGCPYEGPVAEDHVHRLAARLVEAGAEEIGFGDTTGMANPRQVRGFFARAARALPGVALTAHFHDTRGQGLANVLAALESGCTSFESSVGELGGCPVPPGATGNVATEDVVCMLHEMGVRTGVDLEALIACSRRAQEMLGRPLGAHVLVAGPVDWSPAR